MLKMRVSAILMTVLQMEIYCTGIYHHAYSMQFLKNVYTNKTAVSGLFSDFPVDEWNWIDQAMSHVKVLLHCLKSSGLLPLVFSLEDTDCLNLIFF